MATPLVPINTLAWINVSPVIASDTTPVSCPDWAQVIELSAHAKQKAVNRNMSYALVHKHLMSIRAIASYVDVHKVDPGSQFANRELSGAKKVLFVTDELARS